MLAKGLAVLRTYIHTLQRLCDYATGTCTAFFVLPDTFTIQSELVLAETGAAFLKRLRFSYSSTLASTITGSLVRVSTLRFGLLYVCTMLLCLPQK